MLFDIPGLTSTLCFAILSSTMGSSFQIGYAIGVVNAPVKVMKKWLNETSDYQLDDAYATFQWSLIVSAFCIGGMFGAMMTSNVSNRLGRKNGLLINNVLAIAAGVIMALSKFVGMWQVLLAGRFTIGLNAGLNSGLVPLYLAEISPLALRGAVGTIHQLVITASILSSQIMGIEMLLGNSAYWFILFAFPIVPAVFQLLSLPFCPESPRFRFMCQHGQAAAQAKRELMKLR